MALNPLQDMQRYMPAIGASIDQAAQVLSPMMLGGLSYSQDLAKTAFTAFPDLSRTTNQILGVLSGYGFSAPATQFSTAANSTLRDAQARLQRALGAANGSTLAKAGSAITDAALAAADFTMDNMDVIGKAASIAGLVERFIDNVTPTPAEQKAQEAEKLAQAEREAQEKLKKIEDAARKAEDERQRMDFDRRRHEFLYAETEKYIRRTIV